MILVNGKYVDYVKDTTVASLLKKMGFVFPLLIVKINGKLVPRGEYGRTPMEDNDEIQVIHMMSGG